MQPLPDPDAHEGHRFGVNRLLPIHDGTELLSAGRDGIIRHWDTSCEGDPRCIALYGGHIGSGGGHIDWVTDIAVAEERLLISSSNDGTLKLWDLSDGGERRTGSVGGPSSVSSLGTYARHDDYVKAIAVAPSAGKVVSVGLDRRILLWDLHSMVAPLVVGDSSTPSSQQRTHSNDDPTQADNLWKRLRIPSLVRLSSALALSATATVTPLSHSKGGSVYAVDVDEAANVIASGGPDTMIRLFDPRAGPKFQVCRLDGHTDNVRSIRLDTNGTRIVSGSSDGTVRVWDRRQQCCLGIYEPSALEGGMRAIWRVHPCPTNPDIYFSGGRGRQVYSTNLISGESIVMCSLQNEVLDVTACQPTSAGCETELWTATTDATITRWCSPSMPEAFFNGGPQAETGGEEPVPLKSLQTNGMVRGAPGVIKHQILNDKRHILTRDNATPPNVALWDMVKAVQVRQYPAGTDFDIKYQELCKRYITVRSWCSIDCRLGVPTVIVNESTVFDAEMYTADTLVPVDQIEGGPAPGYVLSAQGSKIDPEAEDRCNVGALALTGLFSRWRHKRVALVEAHRGPQRRDVSSPGSDNSSKNGGDTTEDEDMSIGTEAEAASTRSSRSRRSPSPPPLGGLVQPPPDGVTLWVTEIGGGGGSNSSAVGGADSQTGDLVLLHKCVGDFTGHEGAEVLPPWAMDCVWTGKYNTRDQIKLQLLLLPETPNANGKDPPAWSEELSASLLVTVRKVIQYVRTNRETKKAAAAAEGESKENLPPIEILCNNEVLDPQLCLGAVNQYIWKDPLRIMVLKFRPKQA